MLIVLGCGLASPEVWVSTFVSQSSCSCCVSSCADALIRDKASPVKEFMLIRGGRLRLESGEARGVSSEIKSAATGTSSVVMPSSSGGVRDSFVDRSLVCSDMSASLDKAAVSSVFFAVSWFSSAFFAVSWFSSAFFAVSWYSSVFFAVSWYSTDL